MDFFDNAVSKTKEVIDIACKKTGEVVSIEKQKFDISTLKSKQEKDFTVLGRIYYEQLIKSGEMPDGVEELVTSIKEKAEKINELNEQVVNAKNKRICPSCSATIPNNCVFCPTCGAKLTIEDDQNQP